MFNRSSWTDNSTTKDVIHYMIKNFKLHRRFKDLSAEDNRIHNIVKYGNVIHIFSGKYENVIHIISGKYENGHMIMELWKWKYENEIHIFSGEPLLFKSSFTPVYDFGFVGLAVNKVSHHHHQKCVRHGRRHQRYDHLVYDQVYN